MSHSRNSYKRHRFPPEIIAHAVRLYVRFNLSLLEVEEMLLKCGITPGLEHRSHKELNNRAENSHLRFANVSDVGRVSDLLVDCNAMLPATRPFATISPYPPVAVQ